MSESVQIADCQIARLLIAVDSSISRALGKSAISNQKSADHNVMLQQLTYAIRMLMKNPGVTLVAVITLALGIGANTAIFSVVNGVLLRPLQYKNPDRVVSLWENVPGHGRWRAAPGNFFDWKKQNTLFEEMAAYGGSALTLTGAGEPEQLIGTRVSSGYFAVVGVAPVLGRSFLPEEYEPGKGQVVILSHSLWQSRFGGLENIVNKSITLDGTVYTVVGVMPSGIYPMRPTTSGRIDFDQTQQQYWLPMSFTCGMGRSSIGARAWCSREAEARRHDGTSHCGDEHDRCAAGASVSGE